MTDEITNSVLVSLRLLVTAVTSGVTHLHKGNHLAVTAVTSGVTDLHEGNHLANHMYVHVTVIFHPDFRYPVELFPLFYNNYCFYFLNFGGK